jgi:hypothetical protein
LKATDACPMPGAREVQDTPGGWVTLLPPKITS